MRVVIIGAGTGAANVADILIHDKNFKLYGFVGTTEEEGKFTGKKLYNEIPFLGDHSILPKLKENDIIGFVIAIGINTIREKSYYEAVQAKLIPINVISPHTIINPSVKIGKGVVVCAGSVILHGAEIGNNTFIGPGAIVENNARIGENCIIASSCVIGGECEIGRNVKLNVRSTLTHRVNIGKNQQVGAGVIVSESLPDLVRSEFE